MTTSLSSAQGLVQLTGAAALMAAMAGPAAVQAADLGGACCADLEERIAELEATTARKGNRKVSLTVGGHVNRAVLFWDDGTESNAYVVGNKNDQTNVFFVGEAEFAPGWKAGYDITIRFRDNLSDDVNQVRDNGETPLFQMWQSHWYIENDKLGKVSVGLASRATDTAPETDLSETGVASYAGVQDVAGGFRLRSKAGAFLSEAAWGDLYSHLNGDTANVVRYDSPEIAGFVASATWGEDDIWDVALRYAGEAGGFSVEGVIAYTEISDAADENFGNAFGLDQSILVGSAAVLHEPSGLNVTFAGGHRSFDGTFTDLDGAMRSPEDSKFAYGKLGWIAKLNGLGPTAFYGEYGWFQDFISVSDDATLLADLSGGAGARIAGSEAEILGAWCCPAH